MNTQIKMLLALSTILSTLPLSAALAEETANIPSSVPLTAQVGAFTGANSTDSSSSSVPTAATSTDDSEDRYIYRNTLELSGGSLIQANRGASTRQGYSGTLTYRHESRNKAHTDPWTDIVRMKPERLRLIASLELGASPGFGSEKTKAIGGATAELGADIFHFKMAVAESARRFNADAVISLCSSPGNKNTMLCLGGGAGLLSTNRDTLDGGIGYIGRASVESFIGPNVSLILGAEAGAYTAERKVPPSEEAKLLGASFDVSMDPMSQQKAFAKARISSDRDKRGLIYYVEPSAVYDRVKGGASDPTAPTETAFTAGINVGIAGAGI